MTPIWQRHTTTADCSASKAETAQVPEKTSAAPDNSASDKPIHK